MSAGLRVSTDARIDLTYPIRLDLTSVQCAPYKQGCRLGESLNVFLPRSLRDACIQTPYILRYSLVNVLSLLRALLDVGQVVGGHGVDERLQLLLLPRRVELRVHRPQVRLDDVQEVGQNVEHLQILRSILNLEAIK